MLLLLRVDEVLLKYQAWGLLGAIAMSQLHLHQLESLQWQHLTVITRVVEREKQGEQNSEAPPAGTSC
jgi:hypothetical protein